MPKKTVAPNTAAAIVGSAERQLLADIYDSAQERRKKKVAGAPEVGIFWVFNGKPLIDGTPINEAQDYGDFKLHPRDHAVVWSQYQRIGAVPRDLEYDEVPRGRVTYNAKTRQFTFFADPKILQDKAMVQKILEELHLPSKTPTSKDPHYQTRAVASDSGPK